MHGYQGQECHSGINNKGDSRAGKKKRKIPRCQTQMWEWKPEWLVIKQPGQSGGEWDLTQISPHHQESWMWQHTERENVAWVHWKRGWGLRSYIKATAPVKRRLVHQRLHPSRAPGAERQAKEHWADARPWPSCPGIRLPIRSSRKIGGFGSEVKVKTPFWLSVGKLPLGSMTQDWLQNTYNPWNGTAFPKVFHSESIRLRSENFHL